MKQKILQTFMEYLALTLATMLMAVGIYVFRFPNHFSFGGVTGIAVILTAVLPVSPTVLTNIMSIILLVLGFIFLGKGFGGKTAYVTLISTVMLGVMEELFPMTQPITTQPVLELIFAILLPAASSAVLFNLQASGGGTDILAMILKKYTGLDIGTALILVDATVAFSTFFFFGAETGLFSVAGLLAKTLIIDSVIESINLCKFFTIITDDPNPIVQYIHEELNRSATVQHAEGTYTHMDKTVILTVTKRRQAVQLRAFVRKTEPTAFMMITNSSEIIGKGFRGFS